MSPAFPVMIVLPPLTALIDRARAMANGDSHSTGTAAVASAIDALSDH
jgi:hypothetical protein